MQRTVLVRLSLFGFAFLLFAPFDLAGFSQEPDGLVSDDFASSADLADQLPDALKPKEFNAGDIVAAETMVQSMHVADWLGPLAPVALSPFFGLACLSGLSIWGLIGWPETR